MFVFRSCGHEAEFRYWHARQLQQHDSVVMLVNWPICLIGLRTIWRFSQLRSRLWLAVITAIFVAERAVPTWVFLRNRQSYLQHRALILGFVRICIVITTVAYLDVWHEGIDHSYRKDFMHAFVIGSGYIGMLYSAVSYPGCNMAYQLLHVASGFALHARVLQQMQPGMHYLHPFTSAVRQRVPMATGLGDCSLLLCWYTLLEVLVGVLLPFLLSYVSQLRDRRRWRKLRLRSLGHPSGAAGGCDTPAASHAQQEPPELSILPVWTLYLPQAAVLLFLSFAAGQGADTLLYMV